MEVRFIVLVFLFLFSLVSTIRVYAQEIPYADENYYSRKPTPIKLKKGWNEVLVKVPVGVLILASGMLLLNVCLAR